MRSNQKSVCSAHVFFEKFFTLSTITIPIHIYKSPLSQTLRKKSHVVSKYVVGVSFFSKKKKNQNQSENKALVCKC